MSNKMTRNGSRLIGGGIIVALLTLFAILHSTALAHNQNGQDAHTIVSLSAHPSWNSRFDMESAGYHTDRND